MKVCNAHRAFWKAWKDEPNVSAEHPTTIAQAGSFQALVDDGGPLAFDLEADEASLRYCHKPFEGERASARSDLEFYRRAWGADERTRVDGSVRQTGSVFVSIGFGHEVVT